MPPVMLGHFVYGAILVSGIAATDGHSLYNNACVTRHLRLLSPAAAFDGDEEALTRFVEALSQERGAGELIDAPQVRRWAENLLQGAGLSTRGLQIVTLPQGGCRNLGVFEVRTDDAAYVAKRSFRTYEAVRLATMQMQMTCYPRDADPQDRNHEYLGLPGDDLRAARVMPLVAWDYLTVRRPDGTHKTLPLMLLERARGQSLDRPRMEHVTHYTAREQGTFLQRAYAVGVSLAAFQLPVLQGSSRVHVFERSSWKHEDLHMSNLFFDSEYERLELIDCIEMRRSPGWQNDLRGLVLHRDEYPIDDPLRRAWSRALAYGYLSRASGKLFDELYAAFSGTLIYTADDLADPEKRAAIW